MDGEFNISDSVEERRLRQLQKWLKWEVSSVFLFMLAFVLPFGILIKAMLIAAVGFTPFMLLRLGQARKFGWIVGFVVVVVAPAVVTWAPGGIVAGRPGYSWLPLVTFYFYTWILKNSLGEWIETMQWKRRWEYEDARGERGA